MTTTNPDLVERLNRIADMAAEAIHTGGRIDFDPRGVEDDLRQAAARIEELEAEIDASAVKLKSLEHADIHYKVWKLFYGALLAVPADNDTPLEVRVKRQANIITDMQYRIRNLRKEIRRRLKADPVDPNKWFNGQAVYEYGRRHFEAARAAKARIEELEQALRPFADIADLIDCETEGLSDTDECNLLFHDYLMARYTVAQFRHARSALGAS